MFKLRLLSLIVLIPVVVALIFFAPVWLFIVGLTTILGLAAWEWANLSAITSRLGKISYTACLLIATLGFCFIPLPFVFVLALFVWIFATIMLKAFPKGEQQWVRSYPLRCVSGVLVLAPFALATYFIWQQSAGALLLLYGLIIVWCTDIGAYLIGKRFGKTKLAPLISPKKTREGVYGGLIAVMIAASVMSCFVNDPIFFKPAFFILIMLVFLAALVGDLAESAIKRFAKVKDSGALIPGHGGILDRIDSLTAAMPIYALGIWLIQRV